MNTELEQKIIHIIQQKGKIEAIKFYKNYMETFYDTKVSLIEAKETIENIDEKIRRGSMAYVADSTTINKTENNNLNDELVSLIAQGKLIHAVKHYRDATNVSLKEAKDYIEALKAQTTNTPNKASSNEFTPSANRNTLSNKKNKSTRSKNDIWIVSAIITIALLFLYFLFFKQS